MMRETQSHVTEWYHPKFISNTSSIAVVLTREKQCRGKVWTELSPAASLPVNPGCRLNQKKFYSTGYLKIDVLEISSDGLYTPLRSSRNTLVLSLCCVR